MDKISFGENSPIHRIEILFQQDIDLRGIGDHYEPLEESKGHNKPS
jgi:hypothetical protein